MIAINSDTDLNIWYAGPERRLASKPRRLLIMRRYRKRIESPVSDCRFEKTRRKEDDDGCFEF